jgi:glycosyltransferase involved in cell wall biosynthesis
MAKKPKAAKPIHTPPKNMFVSVVTSLESVHDSTVTFFTETLDLLKQNYTDYELVIVANGTHDEEVEKLQPLLTLYPCIRIIRLARKYNQEVSTFAAVESAIGDYVVVASPLNDPPEIIPQLVASLETGHDIVFGVSDVPLPYPILAQLGRKWFFWYSGHYLEIDIPIDATYLMGMNRRAVNALTQIKGQHRHIRHISAKVGFKTSTLNYTPNFKNGFERRGFLKSANLALEIAVSYSRHPLRLMSKLSLIVSGLNLAFAAYAIITYIMRDGKVAEGWTTLSLEMSIMFFFVFLMLSIIAEYIGQMREDMRDAPPYHIMDELISNVLIADEDKKRNIAKQ